jgi:hypothetical protein
MHHKYAKDGLVCMSVNLDEKEDASRSLTYLRSQKAVFANYLLDEQAEEWSRRLDISVLPAVMVFGRDGQRVKLFTTETGPFTYVDVEKLVAPLLQKHN